MIFRRESLKWIIFFFTILHRVMSLNSVVSSNCHLGVIDNNKLYNYSLDSPMPLYPHGLKSEDGFYKVVGNKTVLWFQLCDGIVFNHDPPRCVDCSGEKAEVVVLLKCLQLSLGGDCGGPSHCGMGCSALVVKNIGGYDVCTTIGRASSMDIKLIDKNKPDFGVIVKTSSNGLKNNCSISVSVICDPNGVQGGPHSLEKSGTCDYATVLKHPSGCAKIVHAHGKGLGWFANFLILVLSLFGVYLLAGAVYRYYSLGVRGIDIIPNLDFWTGLPQQAQSLSASVLHKFRGTSQGHRSSYSPVSF